MTKVYNQYEEIINYLIMGVLATVVSIASYAFFRYLGINYLISNIFSWICAVSFAFLTNKKIVFKSKSKGKRLIKEMVMFLVVRLFTLFLETATMFIIVEIINFNDLIAKILAQIIVIVSNYIFSKIFVFKNID